MTACRRLRHDVFRTRHTSPRSGRSGRPRCGGRRRPARVDERRRSGGTSLVVRAAAAGPSTVTMRLRRTPRRSWSRSHVHIGEQLVLGERPARPAGVDAERPQHLGPVDVADAGDHGLVEQQRADRRRRAAHPVDEALRVGVAAQRVGAERRRRAAAASSGVTTRHVIGPDRSHAAGVALEAEADQPDRRPAAAPAGGATCR